MQFISSCYYLIESGTSTFFRILSKSDEVICFLEGKSFEIFVIDKSGSLNIFKLGRDILNGELPQAVIPKDSVASFKTRKYINDESSFSLFACVCGPAFNYDFCKILKDEEIKEHYKNVGNDMIDIWRADIDAE